MYGLLLTYSHFQEVSEEPDSAPSPKRRRLTASRRQVERFLDLAAEDATDDDEDDADDGYTGACPLFCIKTR